MRLTKANDQDINETTELGSRTYTIYADFTNEEEMVKFVDFLKAHTLSSYIDMMYCIDEGYGEEIGDTIVSEDYDTKAEFVKDVRGIVREFKKSLK